MKHRRFQPVRWTLVLLLCGAFIAPPLWAAEVPDAGDEAFVRRILPMVWGRDPLSSREVRVMVQIIQQTSRQELIRGLAKAPIYRKRWAPFLRDLIAVYRIGDPTNTAQRRIKI